MQGTCPECGSLEDITPTGEPIPKKEASRYWRVGLHPDKRGEHDPERGWPICDGSGSKI